MLDPGSTKEPEIEEPPPPPKKETAAKVEREQIEKPEKTNATKRQRRTKAEGQEEDQVKVSISFS